MSPEQEERRRRAQMAGEGALEAQTRFMQDTAKRIPKAAPAARAVAKGAAGAPALIYDAASLARAENKWREAALILGGLAGGAIGGAMGGATGLAAPVAAPAGAAIGSAAGQNFATEFYDQNYARIRPVEKAMEDRWDDMVSNARRMADTKTWMAERAAQMLRADPSFNRISRLTRP